MESLFSRIGLAAAGLCALALVLVADVWLTPDRETGGGPSTSVFDMQLVTRDGRSVSSARWGVPLALSPVTVFSNFPGRTTGPYRINSFGLRGPETTRVPSGPRVITVGGSTAFGLLVNDGDDFGSVLGRELGVEVLNGGVPGFLSMQELGLAVFDLLDLAPKLIVVLDGWNDVYDAYWWARHGDRKGSRSATNVTFEFLENRLVDRHRVETSVPAALAQFGRTVMRKSTLLSGLARWVRRERPVRAAPSLNGPWMDGVVDGYVKNIVKLRDFAAARGCALLVVLQPELGQLLPPNRIQALAAGPNADFIEGDGYWHNVPALYRGFRLRAFRGLEKHAVDVIDATKSFQNDAAFPTWFRDPVHLSRQGHAALAARLREPTLRALTVSPRPLHE